MLDPNSSLGSRSFNPSTRSGLPPASPKFHSNFGVTTVSGPSSKLIVAPAGAAVRQKARTRAKQNVAGFLKPGTPQIVDKTRTTTLPPDREVVRWGSEEAKT